MSVEGKIDYPAYPATFERRADPFQAFVACEIVSSANVRDPVLRCMTKPPSNSCRSAPHKLNHSPRGCAKVAQA